MNKLIIFLFIGLSFSACKNESKELKAADEATIDMVPSDTLKISEKPKFSDPAAQEYVDAYDAMITDYIAAVKAKDQVKLQELGTKMVTLSTKGVEALKNLKGDEAVKLTEYIKAKGNEFSQISKIN